MDVTSLLNTASTKRAGTAKEAESPAHMPVRNRTPWDAGGYSLPINSATQAGTFPTSDNNHSPEESRDSRLDSSDSAGSNHKASDSRSSISSLSSTSTSYHSRLSSISTVSSFYPLSVITDIGSYTNTLATPITDKGSELQSGKFTNTSSLSLILDLTITSCKGGNFSSSAIGSGDCSSATGKMAYLKDNSLDERERVIFQDHPQQIMEDLHKSITPSPTDSLNALAAVAEHQLHDRQEVGGYHQQEPQQYRGISSAQEHSGLGTALEAINAEEFTVGERIHRRLTRSASPSDAILIKRNGPMSMSSSATTPTSSTTGVYHPYGLPSRQAE